MSIFWPLGGLQCKHAAELFRDLIRETAASAAT
jgi:hypothetical protein